MLEFDLLLCLTFFLIVGFLEYAGIPVKETDGNKESLKNLNTFFIGNKKIFALPYFYTLTIVNDLESQIRNTSKASVLLYFIIIFPLLLLLFFRLNKIDILSYWERVKLIFQEIKELSSNNDKKTPVAIEIKFSNADFIFFINDFIFMGIIIITTAILLSKSIYYFITFFITS